MARGSAPRGEDCPVSSPLHLPESGASLTRPPVSDVCDTGSPDARHPPECPHKSQIRLTRTQRVLGERGLRAKRHRPPPGANRSLQHPTGTMVSWAISRLVVLLFGTLYPAYSSYKAVKTKNVKEYVKWMMYWIVFAIFTAAETATDLVISWFPFYFELKIALVIWLLSPYTKGSSVLYRKFIHPTLSSKEKEIDEYIAQARDKSYETMMRFGKRGLNLAANVAVNAATKGQGVLSEKLRSFSMQDLSLITDEDSVQLRRPQSRPRSSSDAAGCLETYSNSGTGTPVRSSSEELASKSNGSLSDTKTDQSDEDNADKAPKRTQSLKASKKPTKSEAQAKNVRPRPKKKAAPSNGAVESS